MPSTMPPSGFFIGVVKMELFSEEHFREEVATPSIADYEKNEASKIKKMLIRLREGPLLKGDIAIIEETGITRGHAIVCTMRKSGMIINTVWIDGKEAYELIDETVTKVRMTASMQEKYYQTKHWKSLARKRKEFDGMKCQQCKADTGTIALHTHHWQYRLFHEDMVHDLMTLCETCHDRIHDQIKGSGVHFTDFATFQIIENIEAGYDHDTDSDFGSENSINEGVITPGGIGHQGQGGSDQDIIAISRRELAVAEPSGGTEVAGGAESWNAPF